MFDKLGPIIDRWYFTDLPIARAASAGSLLEKWKAQETRTDVAASTFGNPMEAMQAAIAAATPTDRIAVFGSFYTVGGVLQHGLPRLHAKHLA